MTDLQIASYLSTTPFAGSLEYPMVVRGSRDRARLERLHRTPCTVDAARALFARLLAEHPIYANGFQSPRMVANGSSPLRIESVKLRFMGRRGRASIRLRGREVRVAVSLPNLDHRLRIGLVLHEYAHHLAGLWNNHNHVFIRVLDDLCAWFDNAPALVVPVALPVAAEVRRVVTPGTKRVWAPRSRCVGCRMNTTRVHSVAKVPCCGRCEDQIDAATAAKLATLK